MRTAADLLIEGVKLWPGFGSGTIGDAAVVVRDGRIVWRGSRAEAGNWAAPGTRRIDGDGGLLLPAFCDLHTHFLLGSLGQLEIDLRGVAGKVTFRERLRAALAGLSPGEWLTGGYWNEEDWPGDGMPDRTWIDDLAPANPVLLYRHDLHQALCNGAALKAAFLAGGVADPPGGRIVRDAGGTPTGNLLEGAVTLVKRQVPQPGRERRRAALRNGMRMVNALGLTAISDMVEGPDDIALYFEMAQRGELSCRFELLLPLPQREALIGAGMRAGIGIDLVRLGPMKGFMDGSLGSRTALMQESYADNPGNYGHLLEMADPPEKLQEMMRAALAAGFPTAVHAIGDRANALLLDIYGELADRRNNLRCRVEHAQHLRPQDIPRFAALDLLVSMQPIHLADDARFVETAIGPRRAETSYALRSLLDAGARIAFGSDWPVASIDPIAGIDAAVNRRASDGSFPHGWLPEEKITVPEAVRAYTESPAWARKQENVLGRIECGLEADLVILDRDIFSTPAAEIGSARVLRTFLRGRQVYPEVEA